MHAVDFWHALFGLDRDVPELCLWVNGAALDAQQPTTSVEQRNDDPAFVLPQHGLFGHVTCLETRFTFTMFTNRSMILIRSSSVSDVNRITSSRRLRNSGLNAFFTSLRTMSSI